MTTEVKVTGAGYPTLIKTYNNNGDEISKIDFSQGSIIGYVHDNSIKLIHEITAEMVRTNNIKYYLTPEIFLDHCESDNTDVTEITNTQIIDQHRWSTVFSKIVKYKNYYWKVTWTEGSTELQDDGMNNIQIKLVFPSYKVVVDYT